MPGGPTKVGAIGEPGGDGGTVGAVGVTGVDAGVLAVAEESVVAPEVADVSVGDVSVHEPDVSVDDPPPVAVESVDCVLEVPWLVCSPDCVEVALSAALASCAKISAVGEKNIKKASMKADHFKKTDFLI